jgi:hypothetical protein
MFGKHLLLTNTISCGVLMAAGDLIQQYIERYRTPTSKPFDWKRTGLCYGTVNWKLKCTIIPT